MEFNILTQVTDLTKALPQSIASSPVQLVVVSISTKEIISKWASSQYQEKDKFKKSFDKMPVDYKRMLLFTYSEGHVIPEELNIDAMNFSPLRIIKHPIFT